MESAAASYASLCEEAERHLSAGDAEAAVRASVSAITHLDGAMRFAGKYEGATFSIPRCVEIIGRYAPVRLHREAVDAVRSLVKERRRIERESSESIADYMDQAEEVLFGVYRALSSFGHRRALEESVFLRALEGSSGESKNTLELLLASGVVSRSDAGAEELRIESRLGERWIAACFECGVSVIGAKREFFVMQVCPRCSVESDFVLIKPQD